MKTRRAAREWVMKALYAKEISGDSLEWITEQLKPETYDSQFGFAEDLLTRTDKHADLLDQFIRSHVEKWELERIAVLDLIILRIAICELRFFPDIPPKVTINEAIEIAKKYSTAKSDKFVNGVLDAVLRDQTPITSADDEPSDSKT
ncbi:transcription antitermination factor NusB [bacterium]|nr:transcription antitermination factor NusB [bacterium]MBU1651130.1 transcription antitermination factor NusB [bacterium]MBU1882297.1 transcription antitermination factor NusB [bacterium]